MARIPSNRQQQQQKSHAFRKASRLLICAFFCAGSSAFQQHSFHAPRRARTISSVSSSRQISPLLAAKRGTLGDETKPKPLRQKPGRKVVFSGKREKNVEQEKMKGYRAILDHKILTKEEEQVLGKKIRAAIVAKETMAAVVEEKHVLQFEKIVKEQEYRRRVTADLLFEDYGGRDMEYEEDFDGLSIHSLDVESLEEVKRYGEDLGRVRVQSTEDYVESLLNTGNTNSDFIADETFTSPEVVLTDEDIETKLGIVGGRKELSRVLIEGAMARDKLISSNVRLVLSIAKKWCRGSSADAETGTLYGGSWTRPSLDEAIQEGIIGLATAADRFDYTRNLKFGTYATYWITNSVRNCFQRASTGCLRVPDNFYQVRQKYQRIVKAHYHDTGGEAMPIFAAAKELGLAPKRLEFILRSTESLVPLDAPVPNGLVPTQAGKAGSTDVGGESLLVNTVSCSDLGPEERVEMSLLRQCLENAMATELSPHERDVLRLRHGLDDGVSRTMKEVCDLLGTLSVSDVRKSENSAFRKLRSPYSVHTYHLLGFLDYVGVEPQTPRPKQWSTKK